MVTTCVVKVSTKQSTNCEHFSNQFFSHIARALILKYASELRIVELKATYTSLTTLFKWIIYKFLVFTLIDP